MIRITNQNAGDFTDAELASLPTEVRNDLLDEWRSYLECQDVDTYDPDMAYERYLENGGPAADIIWWENEQDRLREAGMIAPW